MSEDFRKLTKKQLQEIIDECKAEINRIKKKLKRNDLSDDRRTVLSISMKALGDRLTNAKRERDKPVRKDRHPGRKGEKA